MALPDPKPGLVIAYAYLWRDEASAGFEEGRKDRPCVVVLAVETVEGATLVTVAPITHSPPREAGHGLELPPQTKQRLGLDTAPSWIVASEVNRFIWPGTDLRRTARGSGRYDYGLLPEHLFNRLRERIRTLAMAGRVRITKRDN